jgi:hypothetical protein
VVACKKGNLKIILELIYYGGDKLNLNAPGIMENGDTCLHGIASDNQDKRIKKKSHKNKILIMRLILSLESVVKDALRFL